MNDVLQSEPFKIAKGVMEHPCFDRGVEVQPYNRGGKPSGLECPECTAIWIFPEISLEVLHLYQATMEKNLVVEDEREATVRIQG